MLRLLLLLLLRLLLLLLYMLLLCLLHLLRNSSRLCDQRPGRECCICSTAINAHTVSNSSRAESRNATCPYAWHDVGT